MADEVAEETTSSDDKLMRLPAHKDVWSQKQLFERIISRHFQLLGELGGTRWPVWKVQLLEEGEVNESLEQLNSHLVDLGWLAKLEAGDPWLVQIIPSPKTIPRFQNNSWFLVSFNSHRNLSRNVLDRWF
jgi:hypothetical protein